MDSYDEAKEKLGPAFYGDRNTILHGLHEDKKEAVDKMVEDLEKQLVFSSLMFIASSVHRLILLSLFSGSQRERGIVEEECTMTTLISITSMNAMLNSTRN